MSGEAYFLYHSIGQYPDKARDLAGALAEFAVSWGADDDLQWAYALPKRQRFIDLWTRLIGAAPGSVTTTESVTQAFQAILTALPSVHLSGKSLLVAADCFPSNHFLLQGLAERLGFTLKTVPFRQGAAFVEEVDFLDAWTPDVGLALLTWVSSTSSARIDLHRAAAHGRRMGSLIGVDVTQAVGLIPFDVMAPEVDFAVTTSLKWMCGTPGAGVLYLSPRLIPHVTPQARGWFSQGNPFNWDIADFQIAPDIRRFDTGTPGVIAALASVPAMEWHAAQDHAAIFAHNRVLTARLIDLVDDLGLTLVTPRDPARRGGSIMAMLPARHPAPGVIADLRAQGIAADARGQLLRLSPGIMTTEAGIQRLAQALRRMGDSPII